MKKNNGITLIALIITIIIMLILVAVTISILINSGLIGKAKEAGDSTKEAYLKEQTLGDNLNINGTTYNNIDEYIDSMDNVPVTDIYATVCNNGVLVFSNNVEDINSYMAENNTEVAEYYEIQNIVDNEYTDEHPIWSSDSNITTVKILNNIAPKTTACWFYGLCNLTSMDGLEKINTSNVTNMSWMFYDCTRLTSLNLNNFNTSNVTDMSFMFTNCTRLTSLDLSSFDTSNVTDMSGMFGSSDDYEMGLVTLNISSFNTSNVTDMEGMFAFCNQLEELDVSSFDTSNVTDMSYMFYYAESLQELDLSSFDTGNVTNVAYMFYCCNDLETIYVSNNFDVTDAYEERMFAGCNNLEGGNGTTYSVANQGKSYARIDAPGTPGYFTLKSN